MTAPRHCYTFKFLGRTAGAVGILATWTMDVVAPTLEEARLKLYDTHEHISGVVLLATTEVPHGA
jgi:hypothetical protein